MSSSGEHDGDRPRRSWSEIDKLRDGKLREEERRPRSKAEVERATAATNAYLRKMDDLFSKGGGGPEAERLGKAARDARGTPEFDQACHAYVDALGAPRDPQLASLFLDASDVVVLRAALEGVSAALDAEALELTPGLRTQLRMLAEHSDDDVAYAADQLLERE